MGLRLSKKEVDEWMAKQRDDREPKPRKPRHRDPKECPPLVAAMFASHGVPAPKCEFQFHHEREWRFDYAWKSYLVALEVDGGAFTGGRHTRGKGFIEDQKKINEATLYGWRVFRVTPKEMKSGEAASLIKKAMYGQFGEKS